MRALAHGPGRHVSPTADPSAKHRMLAVADVQTEAWGASSGSREAPSWCPCCISELGGPPPFLRGTYTCQPRSCPAECRTQARCCSPAFSSGTHRACPPGLSPSCPAISLASWAPPPQPASLFSSFSSLLGLAPGFPLCLCLRVCPSTSLGLSALPHIHGVTIS